jgi:hypothetical protein
MIAAQIFDHVQTTLFREQRGISEKTLGNSRIRVTKALKAFLEE